METMLDRRTYRYSNVIISLQKNKFISMNVCIVGLDKSKVPFNRLMATGKKFLVQCTISQKCENFENAPTDAYSLFY